MSLETDVGADERNAPNTATRTDRKRTAAIVLGAALGAIGLRRRSLVGAGIGAVGGWLLYRWTRRKSAVGRQRSRTRSAEPLVVERTTTVGKPPEELYDSWREGETVERVLQPVVAVPEGDAERWRWTIRLPYGRTLSWGTEITDARPGEVVRWEPSEGERIRSGGTVRFRPAPADRGTEVSLRLRIDAPGGAVGDTLLRRVEPILGRFANTALSRFKSLAETGEVPTLEANPSGRGSGDQA